MPSQAWRFDAVPAGARAIFTCVPTVNKAVVAATVGATEAAEAVGQELAALLAGYGSINRAARAAQVPTIGVAHGTVTGCVTEHGVPMAGFDHEFTTTSLFSAGTQAFMLGHIHKHQSWDDGGRLIAYAGSDRPLPPRGDRCQGLSAVGGRGGGGLIPVESRRRRGAPWTWCSRVPDAEQIAAAVREVNVAGAYVRVRWQVGEEERGSVDREAIKRALATPPTSSSKGGSFPSCAAGRQGSTRVVTAGEGEGVARATGSMDGPLIERLEALAHREPAQIANAILAGDEEIGPTSESVPDETARAATVRDGRWRRPLREAEAMELF